MQNYAAQILQDLSTTFKDYQSNPQIEENVIDLALGEIRLEYPEWLTNIIVHSSGHAPLGYVDTQGLLCLRQSYAHLLQEALWTAFLYGLAPGATVLLPKVAWAPYFMWTKALGARVEYYDPLAARLVDGILACMRKYTPSVVVLNFPHNPTGAEISPQEMDQFLDEATETNALIISDEVYRDFAISGNTGSALQHFTRKKHSLISIDSVSKRFGLAGLRIGFLLADALLVKKLEGLRASFGSCVSPVTQSIADTLLRDPRSREWTKAIAAMSQEHILYTARHLTQCGYTVASSGAIYVWMLNQTRKTGSTKASITIGSAVIKGTAGDLFGAPGYLRLCPVRPFPILESAFSDS